MKEIILTNGAIAKVNNSDFKKVNEINWTIQKRKNTNYALGRPHLSSPISMHRFIMNPPKGMVIDHINFDGLDNRRFNLRICTQSENLQHRKNKNNIKIKPIHVEPIKNKLPKDISWNKSKKMFQAKFKLDDNFINVGFFSTIEGAVEARKESKNRLNRLLRYL